MVSRTDARLIAEAAADCAEKASGWKVRALAAEEALRKMASEVYTPTPRPPNPSSLPTL